MKQAGERLEESTTTSLQGISQDTHAHIMNDGKNLESSKYDNSKSASSINNLRFVSPIKARSKI